MCRVAEVTIYNAWSTAGNGSGKEIMKLAHIIPWALIALGLAESAAAQTAGQIEAYERRIEAQQQQLDQMRRELDALKDLVKKSQDPTAASVAASDARPTPEEQFLRRKNNNLNVAFSGRLHRMVLNVDDGANSDLFFTDSEQGPTMLRFDATGKVSNDLSIGATIETGIRQNRPFLVSQDKPDGGTDVTVRMAEIVLDSVRAGKFSFGRGFASAWLAPEIDLSGTQFASLLPVGMLAPGMRFVDASNNSLTDIQVLTYFVDVERLLLVDRVRYDSPSVGTGLQISGSVASDSRWDLTLRAKPKATDRWTLVGGASFQHEPFEGIDRRHDAVFSVRHNATGLNLTVGGSNERLSAGGDVNTWLVKLGWLADIVSLGNTALSIDYYTTSDRRTEGDRAESIGLFAVQKWPEYGLDFYAGYRSYDVKRPDADLRDLDILALGLALNF